MSRRIVFVGGGARSGKSAFALERASELGARRVFLATARAGDDEMRERIARHREERGVAWRTLEEPIGVAARIEALTDADVVVVDCLTLWLTNLLLAGADDAELEARVAELARVLGRCRPSVVLVTNEVGLGIVPENELSRRFRDIAGRAHQRLAAAADEVYLACWGALLRLKPAPVETRWAAAPATSAPAACEGETA